MNTEVRRICKAVFDGELDAGAAALRLRDASRGGKREELSTTFSCTLFALWDLSSENESLEAQRHDRLANLAQELFQNGGLDEDVWLSTAEWDLLEASKTVASVTDARRREVRFYTRVVYVQTRYNLTSECPTGFARLFSALHRLTVANVQSLKRDLCRLVGALKIEPHRVLDALLEFLPPQQHASHQLLELFDRRKAAHLMGRRFQKHREEAEEREEDVERRAEKLPRTTRLGKGDDLRVAKDVSANRPSEKRIPRRYFRLCAALEAAGYLDAEVVFRYLTPSLEETREKTAEFLKGLRAAAREQRFPNLNRPLTEPRSRMTEKDKDVHSVYRDPKKFSYQPQSILQLESPTADDPYLRLAAGFLETTQPGKALRILRSVEDVFCPEVAESCLVAVGRILEPFFARIPATARGMDRFMEDVKTPLFPSLRTGSPMVFEWLIVTGYRLHLSPELLRKAALVMMHEVRFYSHPSYTESSFLRCPAPKRLSVEYLLSTVFLPALLVMNAKPGLEASAWVDALLKLCSYSVRVMVGVHFEEVVTKSAVLDRCAAMAETTARNLVKILVTAPDTETFETNVIPIVDTLGKTAISAPFHVTRVMVQKVQTDVMAAKDLSTAMMFFTPLAFSAFGHHFVTEMISKGAVSKHSEGRISQWYRNMLTFLGHVAHSAPEMLPLHFLLQNALKEIAQKEVIHAHVLRELVHAMTGFQHCSEIGNSQFTTLSGGPMLKSIGLVTAWQKDEIGFNASAVALKRTLALMPRNERRAEAGAKLTLGGHLFVLLIKFLDYIPICGDFAEVASIMEMHSVILSTFHAYLEFLSVYCTAQEYAEMLPPMSYVLNTLKLPMHYVAQLYRPCIAELRAVVVASGVRREPAPTDTESLNRLQLLAAQVMPSSGAMETDAQLRLDLTTLAVVDRTAVQKHGVPSVPSFFDFVEQVRRNAAFQEEGTWASMSAEFYACFWCFQLNDITMSENLYQRQMRQLEEEIEGQTSRSDSAATHLQHKLAALKAEREIQAAHVKFCRDFIRNRRDHLLTEIRKDQVEQFVEAFLQLCLYPRIRLGHEHALFAFEFILIMTKLSVQNFPTLFILNRVVMELFPCLICMTDNEAEGFANFMYEFLRQIERWRSKEAVFRKEFGSFPGAVQSLNEADAKPITHAIFIRIIGRWSNVIVRLLKECLQPQPTGEEKDAVDSIKHRKIMRRPALLVLDRLIPIFPTLPGLANHVRSALEYVTEHDADEGMKTSAQTALARLKKEMESHRPGRWLELDAYNIPSKDSEANVQDETPTMEIDAVAAAPVEVTETQPTPQKDPTPLEELGEMEETEEGEVEKTTTAAARRGRGRKTETPPPATTVEETPVRAVTRKRAASRSEAPSTEAPRKVHVREETRRKREAPQKTETERRKPTRREETRRKSSS